MFVFKSAQLTWLSDTQEMRAGVSWVYFFNGLSEGLTRPGVVSSGCGFPEISHAFMGVFCLFVCFSWFCWREVRRESA